MKDPEVACINLAMRMNQPCQLTYCLKHLKHLGPRGAKRFTEKYVHQMHFYYTMAKSAQEGQRDLQKQPFCKQNTLNNMLHLEDEEEWSGNLLCAPNYSVNRIYN